MPETSNEQELNRRGFLTAAAVAACACALCPAARAADDDDDDDDNDDVPADLSKGPVDAGAAGDYAKDGAYDGLAKSKHILLFREQGKLYAMTAVCTHKKFLLKEKDGQFFCPKHSSRFTHEGVPAPKPNGKIGAGKKPLAHYTVSIDDKKHVIVDTSKPVKLGDAGSSVQM